MKKIHLLWLLAGLLTLATGCSEEDYSELTSSQKLEIVKSDVNFSAEASQGVIEVKTDRILNATSSEEWCTTSISGNIVTVYVESLIAREGRSALSTLSDGVKKAQVTVHQAGIIWGLQGERLYFVPAEANEIQIPAKISCEYDTDFSAPSWMNGELKDDIYTVSIGQNTGELRSGSITFKSVLGDKKYIFVQLGPHGYAGTYTAKYERPIGTNAKEREECVQSGVRLTRDDDNPALYYFEDLSRIKGVKVPLVYDENKRIMKIGNTTFVDMIVDESGNLHEMRAITVAQGKSGLIATSYLAKYEIVFSIEWNEATSNLSMNMIDTGEWKNYTQLAFQLSLFKEGSTINGANNEGFTDAFYFFTMNKD